MLSPIPQPELDRRIRRVEVDGTIYYSMVDAMAVYYNLENDPRTAGQRWRNTKKRLKKEMGQLWEDFLQLKLVAPADGKRYLTDVGTRRDIMRVFMTEKSERSEPFRQWLLNIAHEKERDAGWDASQIHAGLEEHHLEPVENKDLIWWQR